MAVGCQTSNPFQSNTDASALPKKDSESDDQANTTLDQKAPRKKYNNNPNAAKEMDPRLLDAEEFYRLEAYQRAADIFHAVAEDTKNPPLIAEKARFMEGEAKKQIGDLVDAMSTYNRLLQDFSFGVYREQAVARMYGIALYWLEDTWTQLDMEKEKEAGKRWYVPSNFLHFENAKPTFDEESHAVHMLEQVYYNDPTGPYADKALFIVGYVNFCRGHWREADQFLTELVRMEDRHGKRTKLRDQAWEMVIIAKQNCTGGPEYDGRKNAEAIKVIQQAQATSPKFASDHGDWVASQLGRIRLQQAEKDYSLAEYYRKTGHPASAWFYYELVRRRYIDTPQHEMAVARMKELQQDLKDSTDPGFANQTSRMLAKAFLGHSPPTLEPGREIPKVPGQIQETPSPVMPASNVEPQQVIPTGNLPRQ